jgi:tetratricopeptide (TPR) repeat protein
MNAGLRFIFAVVAMALIGYTGQVRGATLNDLPARFDAGNKFYEQGKFSDAANEYQGILRERIASPALYFNLGNALFKDGQIGRAIAAYRQAEQLAPRDPDVRANLQFVRNQIQGPSLAPDRWQNWLGKLTLNEWSSLAMIAFWVWLTLLILAQWRPGLKPAIGNYIYSAGIITGCLVVCVATLLHLRQSERHAVVTAPEAATHNGPLDESPVTFTIHDGAELRVLDEKNHWLQIDAGTGRSGWIRRDQVEVLPRS